MFFKTGVLKYFANFTGKHMCRSLFLIKLACNFIKNANSSTGETPANETPAQVFFCEICGFFQNSYFYRILRRLLLIMLFERKLLQQVVICQLVNRNHDFSFFKQVHELRHVNRSRRYK